MTAGNREWNIARKWISECDSMDEVAGLIALDVLLNGMPRQLDTLRDRKLKTVREEMEVDDFMGICG